ncbi:MAG: transketolase [Acidobacteria bacterium]|nr:transketolase [Acidobacteriota bacterium]
MTLHAAERRCLEHVFTILELNGLGHTGGSLSVLQTLVALYFDVARVDPANPAWPDRDRIVLSKAHACEAMYAVLAERGFFPAERFAEYLRFGSMLQGHTERCTPGVEYSGGSLGQGICFAAGLAYAAKLRRQQHRIFCIVGDGECHEGSVWEAAMFGAHYRLDNLYVAVDYNHYADHANISELMELEPFVEKWRSFGWETVFVEQGNDVERVAAAFKGVTAEGRPKCLVVNTVKNCGVAVWAEHRLHQANGQLLRDGLAEGRARLHVE